MYSKQKSFNFGQYVPNDKVLNKKIHENPKYKHVKPAVDTGKSIKRHIDELKEKQKINYHKKDEVFKRIKVSAFIKLAITAASDLLKYENDLDDQASATNMYKASQSIEHRSIANVLMGVGELDLVNEKRKIHPPAAKPELIILPYLLLDVRDRDAFLECHIKTAKHYPSAMLSRSTGYETEELKSFKNNPYAIITVYDDDEVIAVRVATTLVERGYDNLYLLTGGLKLAMEICPQNLTTSNQKLTSLHIPTEGATSLVQKCPSKEYFSKEDIAIIQSFVDAYPNKGNHAVWSSQTSQSWKEGSSRSCQSTSISDSRHTFPKAPTISRTSTCNSVSTEQMHLQSARTKSSRHSQTRSCCSRNLEPVHLKPAVERNKKPPWK